MKNKFAKHKVNQLKMEVALQWRNSCLLKLAFLSLLKFNQWSDEKEVDEHE